MASSTMSRLPTSTRDISVVYREDNINATTIEDMPNVTNNNNNSPETLHPEAEFSEAPNTEQ